MDAEFQKELLATNERVKKHRESCNNKDCVCKMVVHTIYVSERDYDLMVEEIQKGEEPNEALKELAQKYNNYFKEQKDDNGS